MITPETEVEVLADAPPTPFSDETVYPIPSDVSAPVVEEFDVEKAITELKDSPATLAAVIKKYTEDSKFTPLTIILVRMESVEIDPRTLSRYIKHTWHVVEGLCDLKNKTFKIAQVITKFDANPRDPLRPPTAALNFVASCSVARGLSIWVP